MTRSTVASLAQLRDPGLAGGIDVGCSFPNSMVNCIEPVTERTEIALARALDIDAAAPVTHEDCRQWVIEDGFCAGRPNRDEVGATFTDGVHDCETMKIRILNAGHQVPANSGELPSVGTIAECMAHPQIPAMFREARHEGIAPCAAPVPGMTSGAFIALIVTRRRPAGPWQASASWKPCGRACVRALAKTDPPSSRTTRAGATGRLRQRRRDFVHAHGWRSMTSTASLSTNPGLSKPLKSGWA